MQKITLEKLFKDNNTDKLAWSGKCHDCGKEHTVNADIIEEQIIVSNGAVYDTSSDGLFIKCQDCFEKDATLRNFRTTEVYSRCVGYLRPVSNWNPAKQEEFKLRKEYEIA